jgi:hypothetical protein
MRPYLVHCARERHRADPAQRWHAPAPARRRELADGIVHSSVEQPGGWSELGTDVRARTLEGGLGLLTDAASTTLVNDGSVSTELTTQFVQPMDQSTLEDGRIIFLENDQVHVWSAVGGEHAWLVAIPAAAIQTNGVAYFVTEGPRHTLPW